jgi:hypothetical protein
MEHRIDTGVAKPIRRPPYRVPYALRKEMETQAKDMLEKDIIEQSSSPWSAPAILVPKRSLDGSPNRDFASIFELLIRSPSSTLINCQFSTKLFPHYMVVNTLPP